MPHGLVNDSDGLGRRPRTESPKFSAIGSLTVAAAFQPIQRFQRAAEVATIHRKSVGPRLGQSICSSHFCGIKDRGQRVLNLTECEYLRQKTTQEWFPPTGTTAPPSTCKTRHQTQRLRIQQQGTSQGQTGQFDAGQISGRNTLLWGQRTHRNPVWILGRRQQSQHHQPDRCISDVITRFIPSGRCHVASVLQPRGSNALHHFIDRLIRAQEPLGQLPLDPINPARLWEVHLEAISNLQPNQHHTDRGSRGPTSLVGTNWGESGHRPQTTAGLE